MPDWIKVDERMPEKYRYVLCCCANVKRQCNIVKGYWDGNRWCCEMNSNITHWMPLPEPPTEVLKNG